MQDNEERRRQRERLVAYYVGWFARTHGIDVAKQPDAMARLAHFAQVGQEGLEEERLTALETHDDTMAKGPEGPVPFRVRIELDTLRSIFAGTTPPPVDDAQSAAARVQAAALRERQRAEERARAQREIEATARKEQAQLEIREVVAARRRMFPFVVLVFAAVVISAVVLLLTRHPTSEKKSEDSHANHR